MTKLSYVKITQILKTIKNVNLKSYTSGSTDMKSRRHTNICHWKRNTSRKK